MYCGPLEAACPAPGSGFCAGIQENNGGPFELGAPGFAYFFDSGIIIGGLLAAWQRLSNQRYLRTAAAIGWHMLRDHVSGDDIEPMLSLPSRVLPVEVGDGVARPGAGAG